MFLLVKHHHTPTVCTWRRRLVSLPMVGFAVCAVGEYAHMVGVADDDCAIRASGWTPLDVWGGVGLGSVVADDRVAECVSEGEW